MHYLYIKNLTMKKLLLSITTLILSFSSIYSQTTDNRFRIGLHTGAVEYLGELNRTNLNFGKAYRAQVGVSGAYAINRFLNLGIEGTMGSIGYLVPDKHSFRANLIQGNANLKLKFNNGLVLKEDARVRPYIYLGLGVANFSAQNDPNEEFVVPGTDMAKIYGLGLDFMLTSRLGLNYNLNVTNLTSDKRDGISLEFNDKYVMHTVGIVYNLGKAKDSDGDGVNDTKDRCPDTPAGVMVDKYGCPLDSDKDGIPDYLDKCPTEAGTEATNGCPDSDGDGVIDLEDECPNEKGTIETNGCPDSDGDGVRDSEDRCPDVAGTKANKGCPDSDNDGVIDPDDKCPDTPAGVKVDKNGCPLEVSNPQDAGKTPEQIASEKNLAKLLEDDVRFTTAEYTLNKGYRAHLDKVAAELKNNKAKVLLEGHADSRGDKAFNEPLSKNRANAVKNYLVKKGVSADRINVEWYGEDRPKAPNTTVEGQGINRRVEMKIVK